MTSEISTERGVLARSGRDVAFLICLNAAFYFVIFSATRLHLDFSDMIENYAWGISWALGNNKHPPLFGWIAAAWFEVFPRTDSAYYLLAALNLAAAYGFLALCMKRFLSPPQVFVAVVLTMLFTRFGLDAGYKYNANASQYPFITGFLWAALRGLETHRFRWWFLTGCFVAAAVLCKYSAAVLIASMGAAAWVVLRPRPAIIVRGAAISAVVACVLVVPHVLWEIRHGWPSLNYLSEAHSIGNSRSEILVSLIAARDLALFSLLSVIVWIAIQLRSGTPRLPFDARRLRLGLALYASAIAMTFAASWVDGIAPDGSWFIVPSLFLGWALVDLSPPNLPWTLLRRRSAVTYAGYMAIFAVVATALFVHDGPGGGAPAYVLERRIARDVSAAYTDRYSQQAEFVAGTFPLPYAFSFYAPGSPQSLSGVTASTSPWIDPQAFQRGSKIIICGALREKETNERSECEASAISEFGNPDTRKRITYTLPGRPDLEANRRDFTALFYLSAKPGQLFNSFATSD